MNQYWDLYLSLQSLIHFKINNTENAKFLQHIHYYKLFISQAKQNETKKMKETKMNKKQFVLWSFRRH